MPNAPFDLTVTDLEDLATGAWILGTGGGGDPYFSLLEAKLHLASGRGVRVVDPLALDDDALVGCVGQMGAPLAMQERSREAERSNPPRLPASLFIFSAVPPSLR